MTTIAYRNGVIASDGRSVFDNVKAINNYRKLIISRKHQCIYGFAGSLTACENVVRFLEIQKYLPWHDPKKPFAIDIEIAPESVDVLVVEKSGLVTIVNAGGWFHIYSEFTAIGSGQAAALAAMYCDKSAIDAINIAAKVDTYTGGIITAYSLTDIPPKTIRSPRRPVKKSVRSK